MNPRFLTETELHTISSSRPIALFGAGYFGRKTQNLLKKGAVLCVDNSASLQGKEWLGLVVQSPDVLSTFLRENKDAYIVVCISQFEQVSGQLITLGADYRSNCGITPLAADVMVIKDLFELDKKIMFSNYDYNSGIFTYDFKTGHIEKKFDRDARGLVRIGNEVFFCGSQGLSSFDLESFEITPPSELGTHNTCGLDFCQAESEIIIGGTDNDEIIFVDYESRKVKERLSLSNKSVTFNQEYHHVNDICIVDDYILVSVFSKSGWWPEGFFDGGVLEIDRKTKRVTPLDAPLMWQPHSITLQNGHLYILDSMNGTLLKDLREPVVNVNGFVRGLEFDDHYAFVGQSQHRHVSRLTGHSPVSVDSGIHIVDLYNPATRFVQFPEIRNIYDILILD